MATSTYPFKLPPAVLRNGVLGGILLVLSQALDQVLYYLNGYVMLVIVVGVVACTAFSIQKSRPQVKLGPLVLFCWGAYFVALAVHVLYSWRLRVSHGPEQVASVLAILLFGGVLSLLVVLVCRWVKPIPK